MLKEITTRRIYCEKSSLIAYLCNAFTVTSLYKIFFIRFKNTNVYRQFFKERHNIERTPTTPIAGGNTKENKSHK